MARASSELEVIVKVRADMSWTDAIKFRIAGADVFREWLREQINQGEIVKPEDGEVADTLRPRKSSLRD